MEIVALVLFAFAAGFVDSVAGGGGLIQLPALLVFMPGVPHPILFGTNKLASIMGTAVAVRQYVRRVEIPWRFVGTMTVCAFSGSFIGATFVSMLNPDLVKPVVVALLFAVALYTFKKKDLGSIHRPKLDSRQRAVLGALFGAVVGFYDGFLGPGTGSFLIFGYVVLFGFDFLNSSACAKVVNVGTNLAALCFFVPSGNIEVKLALAMGAVNIVGAIVGSRLALKGGVVIVRRAYLIVVSALITKLVWGLVAG